MLLRWGRSSAEVIRDGNVKEEGTGEQDEGDVYVIRNRSGAHYSRITSIMSNITLVPFTTTDLSSVYST
jgi:hypothetical protein